VSPLDFFFCGFVKDIVLFVVKKCKTQISCMTESSELQIVLPVKCLPVPGKELNVILMCVMLLMVPMLRYTEHIRNVVNSSV
jgi:hypothetical protein